MLRSNTWLYLKLQYMNIIITAYTRRRIKLYNPPEKINYWNYCILQCVCCFNINTVILLYQVTNSRVQLQCDGTRHTGGEVKGNWQMEWVASTLHTTSEHGVSSITTADAHTSAASSRLNWRPRRFKWTRPFRRKTKSGFCACAITFQMQSTNTASHSRTF